VEIKYFVNCSIFLLFDIVQYCSCEVGPGRNRWLATLLRARMRERDEDVNLLGTAEDVRDHAEDAIPLFPHGGRGVRCFASWITRVRSIATDVTSSAPRGTTLVRRVFDRSPRRGGRGTAVHAGGHFEG
jgi:hypothetical protein